MNVLVIGKAKTGTTVISKSIQHALRADYHLEPKDICYFENQEICSRSSPQVVKIIFEHWSQKPRMRNAVVYNECELKFDKVVGIVRDVRDEIISRIMYLPYVYFSVNGFDGRLFDRWINVIENKERMPQTVTLQDLADRWGEIFGGSLLKAVLLEAKEYPTFLMNSQARIHVVKYEEFVSGELDALESYLGLKLSSKVNLDDLDRTCRTAKSNNWKEFLTPVDCDFLKKQFGENLENFGYTDWELEPKEKLSSEFYSDYLRRVIGKQ